MSPNCILFGSTTFATLGLLPDLLVYSRAATHEAEVGAACWPCFLIFTTTLSLACTCIFKIYTTRAFSFGGNVPVHVWIKGKRKKKIKWNKGVGVCVERINVPNYISSRSCFHWSVKLLLLGVFLVTYLQMFSILFFIINKIFGLKNTTWIQDNIIYTFGFNVVKLTLPDVLESFSCLLWLGVYDIFPITLS